MYGEKMRSTLYKPWDCIQHCVHVMLLPSNLEWYPYSQLRQYFCNNLRPQNMCEHVVWYYCSVGIIPEGCLRRSTPFVLPPGVIGGSEGVGGCMDCIEGSA